MYVFWDFLNMIINYVYVRFLEVVADTTLSVSGRAESQFAAVAPRAGWGQATRLLTLQV